MNKTCYKQYDTRWASLPYPKKPYLIKNCGCGEVSICNAIIEMEKYASQTPKTIQPYMVQFADPKGNGTYHSGIPTAMRHYGLTNVKEHATMSKLWIEMRKPNRVAILLMGSRLGGTNKVRWSGSGHFVCATGYKEENGKHYLYIKDSASTSSLRNGWISYEGNIQGDCLKVWSGITPTEKKVTTSKPTAPYTGTLPNEVDKYGSKGEDVKAVQNFLNWYYNAKVVNVDGDAGDQTVLWIRKFQDDNGLSVDGSFGPASKKKAQEIIDSYKSVQAKVCEWAEKIADDDSYIYVTQNDSDSKTKKCCICENTPKGSKYHGWNCIRFIGAAYVHGGGVPIKAANHTLITYALANSMLKAKPAEALKLWTDRNGGKWDIIKNDNKKLPVSALKPGDILICYDKEGSGAVYKHMALYVGDGNIIDAASKAKGILKRKYTSLGAKPLIAMRYIGK